MEASPRLLTQTEYYRRDGGESQPSIPSFIVMMNGLQIRYIKTFPERLSGVRRATQAEYPVPANSCRRVSVELGEAPVFMPYRQYLIQNNPFQCYFWGPN